MAAEYPVLCAAITIDTSSDSLVFEESLGGGDLTATIIPGTYYLDEDGSTSTTGNFARAIKDALEAASASGGNTLTYTVDVVFKVDGSAVTGSVTISPSSGNVTLKFANGGTNFNAGLLGFAQLDTGAASSHTGSISTLTSWCPDQPAVTSDPAAVSIEDGLYQHVTPGGAAYTFKTADPREFRVIEFEYIDKRRTWQEETPGDQNRSFEYWWREANDGRPVRLYLQTIDSGTDLSLLTTSELVGTYVLTEQSLKSFAPTRTKLGLDLYGWVLRVREYVS